MDRYYRNSEQAPIVEYMCNLEGMDMIFDTGAHWTVIAENTSRTRFMIHSRALINSGKKEELSIRCRTANPEATRMDEI